MKVFCSKCGTKVSEEAQFCFNCGAEIIGSEHDKEQIIKNLYFLAFIYISKKD